MKRQILKGFTMLMLILAVSLITAVVNANAQSSQSVRGKIPFEFFVGDKKLPAGEYAVKPITQLDAGIVVSRVDGNESAIQLTNNASGKSPKADKAVLVFHRYGHRYYLSQVWRGAEGRELLKSRTERAIQRELSMTASNAQPAHGNASDTETVIIVATLQ